jgi:hypothetical protein
MAKRINKNNNSNIKNERRTAKEQKEIGINENETIPDTNTGLIQNEKINFEIQSIESLLQKTLSRWKENLDSENIKTDTIGDLEKLIKLRLLLIDENEQKKITSEKIMTAVIGIIREVIDDSALRIKLLTKLKEIDISDENITE